MIERARKSTVRGLAGFGALTGMAMILPDMMLAPPLWTIALIGSMDFGVRLFFDTIALPEWHT
jgi:hypothetical protein